MMTQLGNLDNNLDDNPDDYEGLGILALMFMETGTISDGFSLKNQFRAMNEVLWTISSLY
jgi:hypothetical protein